MEFSQQTTTDLNKTPLQPRVVAALVLLGLLIFLTLVFLRMVEPLIMPLLLAAIMALLSYPLFDRVMARVGKRNHVSAVITSLLFMLLIFVPVVSTIALAYRELTYWVMQIAGEGAATPQDWGVWAETRIDDLLGPMTRQIADYLSIDLKTVTTTVVKAATAVGLALYNKTADFLGNLPQMVLSLTTFGLGYYFFLADGKAILKRWEGITPLDPKHDRMVREEFVKVCRGVVWATLLAAVAQAFLVVVGLLIVCAISSLELGRWIILLGLVSVIFAMVPFFGATVVWGSVVIYLLLQQSIVAGIFLLLWGAIVISSADNVVKVVAIKDSAELHPLLVFVSVFGGMQMMGMMGIFLGPVIGAILLSVARVLRFEFVRLGWRRADPGNIVVNNP